MLRSVIVAARSARALGLVPGGALHPLLSARQAGVSPRGDGVGHSHSHSHFPRQLYSSSARDGEGSPFGGGRSGGGGSGRGDAAAAAAPGGGAAPSDAAQEQLLEHYCIGLRNILIDPRTVGPGR